MSYVDGFVLAVPNANKEQYLALATKAAAIFKMHGATRVVECWGDDLPDGRLTDFRMAVKAEPNETVVFSWTEWPSKQARNVARDPVMKEMEAQLSEIPFDGKRVIFGGFEPLLDA